ncbi:MAG: PEP-CTERM sorting domain-containing protein [Desulfobacterales bacterium]|nr:MAG: PEP-CTERM sorting domain-containing protein [Desulfobacterales bacterium]
MYKYDYYGSISFNDLNVNSTTIIIDTPLYVPGIRNINNDGHWEWGYTVSDSNAHPIPEPATMFLLGSGLLALGWIGRKKIINGNWK